MSDYLNPNYEIRTVDIQTSDGIKSCSFRELRVGDVFRLHEADPDQFERPGWFRAISDLEPVNVEGVEVLGLDAVPVDDDDDGLPGTGND